MSSDFCYVYNTVLVDVLCRLLILENQRLGRSQLPRGEEVTAFATEIKS